MCSPPRALRLLVLCHTAPSLSPPSATRALLLPGFPCASAERASKQSPLSSVSLPSHFPLPPPTAGATVAPVVRREVGAPPPHHPRGPRRVHPEARKPDARINGRTHKWTWAATYLGFAPAFPLSVRCPPTQRRSPLKEDTEFADRVGIFATFLARARAESRYRTVPGFSAFFGETQRRASNSGAASGRGRRKGPQAREYKNLTVSLFSCLAGRISFALPATNSSRSLFQPLTPTPSPTGDSQTEAPNLRSGHSRSGGSCAAVGGCLLRGPLSVRAPERIPPRTPGLPVGGLRGGDTRKRPWFGGEFEDIWVQINVRDARGGAGGARARENE